MNVLLIFVPKIRFIWFIVGERAGALNGPNLL